MKKTRIRTMTITIIITAMLLSSLVAEADMAMEEGTASNTMETSRRRLTTT